MLPTIVPVHDDPLELDPLSPLPSRDPRWFIPAHRSMELPDGGPERRADGDRRERPHPGAA
jgi:hypothetical protein